MMRSALIDHTGFVGSNLVGAGQYSDLYNSANIRDMRGEEFDLVVCAGIQAVKWWANQNPAADWDGIQPLLDVLKTIGAGKFVLISTIDVYRDPVGVDESVDPGEDGLHAYGLHRLRAERFVRDQFATAQVVRLPLIGGPSLEPTAGIKGNALVVSSSRTVA